MKPGTCVVWRDIFFDKLKNERRGKSVGLFLLSARRSPRGCSRPKVVTVGGLSVYPVKAFFDVMY